MDLVLLQEIMTLVGNLGVAVTTLLVAARPVSLLLKGLAKLTPMKWDDAFTAHVDRMIVAATSGMRLITGVKARKDTE